MSGRKRKWQWREKVTVTEKFEQQNALSESVDVNVPTAPPITSEFEQEILSNKYGFLKKPNNNQTENKPLTLVDELQQAFKKHEKRGPTLPNQPIAPFNNKNISSTFLSARLLALAEKLNKAHSSDSRRKQPSEAFSILQLQFNSAYFPVPDKKNEMDQQKLVTSRQLKSVPLLIASVASHTPRLIEQIEARHIAPNTDAAVERKKRNCKNAVEQEILKNLTNKLTSKFRLYFLNCYGASLDSLDNFFKIPLLEEMESIQIRKLLDKTDSKVLNKIGELSSAISNALVKALKEKALADYAVYTAQSTNSQADTDQITDKIITTYFDRLRNFFKQKNDGIIPESPPPDYSQFSKELVEKYLLNPTEVSSKLAIQPSELLPDADGWTLIGAASYRL